MRILGAHTLPARTHARRFRGSCATVSQLGKRDIARMAPKLVEFNRLCGAPIQKEAILDGDTDANARTHVERLLRNVDSDLFPVMFLVSNEQLGRFQREVQVCLDEKIFDIRDRAGRGYGAIAKKARAQLRKRYDLPLLRIYVDRLLAAQQFSPDRMIPWRLDEVPISDPAPSCSATQSVSGCRCRYSCWSGRSRQVRIRPLGVLVGMAIGGSPSRSSVPF